MRYHAAQSAFNVCLTGVRAGLGAGDSPMPADAVQVRAAVLAKAAASMRPRVVTVARLDGYWARLKADVPAFDTTMAAVGGPEFTYARALTAQARQAAAAGSRSAAQFATAAAASLRTAVMAGAAELGRRERFLVARVAADAARHLRYAVTRYDGAMTSGIEARRGLELLLIRVGDRGTLEIDGAGLTGERCLAAHKELEAAMSARGVDLVEATQTKHDSIGGGVLIAAAAQRGDANLARATVHDREVTAGHRLRRAFHSPPSDFRSFVD